MNSVCCLLLASAVLLLCGFFVEGQVRVGFYGRSCPGAEKIVRNIVSQAVQSDSSIAPALLRLHFHDCFVQGCDASVLLDSTPSNRGEKDAGANRSLRGLEVIDSIKNALESQCPGTVSCADILAFAARDSVALVGGPFWNVPAGRKDGRVASADEAQRNLPDPTFSMEQLTQSFASKGLTQEDLVLLSGAHSIGTTHCNAVVGRLYGFNSLSGSDPTMDPFLALSLQGQCPQGNPNPNTVINLDPNTPNSLDNTFYQNLQFRKGVLSSDQLLYESPETQAFVGSYASNPAAFSQKFANSMLRMSSIAIKNAQQGEIRKHCRFVN